MNLFMKVKSMLEYFSFIKLSSRLYDGEKIFFEQWWMILIKNIIVQATI